MIAGRSFKPMVRSLVLLILFGSLIPSLAGNEGLWEASRRGDLDRIKTLLSSGVDVNSKTRYGATALSYAADKGHLEVVRFLVEAGADVNSVDTFYEATPLGWALFNGHSEVATFLLGKGVKAAAPALTMGVRLKNIEIVKAALANGNFEASDVDDALAAAKQIGAAQMVALLEKAEVDRSPPQVVEVAEAVLKGYQGTYRNQGMDLTLQIRLQGGKLRAESVLRGNAQTPVTLSPIGETEFISLEMKDLQLSFMGRSGLVERVIVNQGGRRFALIPFNRAAASESTKAPSKPTADEGADRPAAAPIAGAPSNWPSFRGPNANGVADGQRAPVRWSAEDSTNIRWKTPIPGIGNSSPIVWGNRIFVTTSISGSNQGTLRTGLYGDVTSVNDESEHVWKVYCLDKETGSVLWQRESFRGVPPFKRHLKSTHANPTPTTDGQRIVSVFPQGLICYDFDGKLLWKRSLGPLDSGWFYDPSYQWGFSSSPIVYDDLVIVQVDVQGKSFVGAYRLKDGSPVWKTDRQEIPTWSTPSIYRGMRDELITNGTTIRSYDPRTGELLWWLNPNSEVVVATPIVGEDLIYLTAGYPPVRPIYAVRPGGSGDISLGKGESKSDWIAWSHNRGGTYMPSPILYRGILYTCANNGRLTAYDASTGERIYRARVAVGRSFSGSPVASDGRLYFPSETGTVYVVKAGRKFESLAENPIDEILMATPAVSDGMIVVRSLGHVFGIAEPDETATASAPKKD